MSPKKPFSALSASNREPTLSGADWERRLAAAGMACKILGKGYNSMTVCKGGFQN